MIPEHVIFVLETKKTIYHGLKRFEANNIGGVKWSQFVNSWAGNSTDQRSLPDITLLWAHLPQDIPSPIVEFWLAMTNLVTKAKSKNVPILVTSKHTKHEGLWKYQTFRKWRNSFPFLHTKHCMCMYGIRLNNKPFHWKLNVLDIGLQLTNHMCNNWSVGDTVLDIHDSHRLYYLERQFFMVAFQRWVRDRQDSVSTLLEDWEDLQEAQCGPESDGTGTVVGTQADTVIKTAYPTEARERQKVKEKERKAKGIVATKRKKYVEEWHDDCGEDVSSIATKQDLELLYILPNDGEDSSSEPSSEDEYPSINLVHMFWGSGTIGRPNLQKCTLMEPHEMLSLLHTVGPGIDIAELCGGQERSTTLSIRRKLKTGPNFDLVTGFDLNKPCDQQTVKNYFQTHKVLVAVMAPTCGPFGPMGRFVRHVAPESWKQSYM